MIDPGLEGKVALVTGGNNPHGIGAAVARILAGQGVSVFIHFFRQGEQYLENLTGKEKTEEPGLEFFFRQQMKDAGEVIASIQKNGGRAASWEGDFRDPGVPGELFDMAEETFGRVDILVNNAADYAADTFLSSGIEGGAGDLWEGGPSVSTFDEGSFKRHFSANTSAAASLMTRFARRIIKRESNWGRIINITADCAWGSPKEVSYRASKYALESYSRSAAAELGPFGITVNVVSPGPVQSGYIAPELEKALFPDIPLRRVGKPEDVAEAVLFFASDQAAWITGQVLFVHGGHRMAFGQ